jgi:hypothetical protein
MFLVEENILSKLQNLSPLVLMSKKKIYMLIFLDQPPLFYRIQRIRREKKEKERQQKDMEVANRRHLASMRVVQKNLVYIIGLHPKLATEEVKI